jgi:hypothetical protein
MIYYLLIFKLQIKRYELSKFWMKSDSNFCFKICLNLGRPRAVMVLTGTGSFGSRIEAVGSNEIWTSQITWYPFT